MWQIEKLHSFNTRTLMQVQIYHAFFSRMWSKHVYRSTYSLLNNLHIQNLLFTKNNSKLNYKTQYKYNNFKPVLDLGLVLTCIPNSKKLFNIYTTLLTQTTVNTSRLHPSHKFTFLSNKELNISTFNLVKLNQKWTDIYHLLYNLSFYKIPVLSFSTPTFQSELLSLNWSLNSKIRTYWKYISPSFYSARNKVISSEFLIFNYLNKQGFYLAFIFDVTYHKNTTFLLHRNNFFTLGLVPVQTSLYTVNFALPISNESPFLHLFFVRLLTHIKKNTETIYFKQLSSTWSLGSIL